MDHAAAKSHLRDCLTREGLFTNDADLHNAIAGKRVLQKRAASQRVEQSMLATVPFEFHDVRCTEIVFSACRRCHVLKCPDGNNVAHAAHCNIVGTSASSVWETYVCCTPHTQDCPYRFCSNAERGFVSPTQRGRFPADRQPYAI